MFRFARVLVSILMPLLSTHLCLIPFSAQAEPADLLSHIEALFNKDSSGNLTRSITLLTPPTQLAEICDSPELSVSGNDSRLTGNRSVIALCDGHKKFIQVNVQAKGTWWVARRAMKPGSVIQPDDLEEKSGSLAHLPAGVVMSKEDIIGLVAARMINVNQPFVANKIRLRWEVLAGQEVDLLASGPGFNIRSRGKAMDNAALGNHLRVKTNGGQIVTGNVISQGKVSIYIKD